MGSCLPWTRQVSTRSTQKAAPPSPVAACPYVPSVELERCPPSSDLVPQAVPQPASRQSKQLDRGTPVTAAGPRIVLARKERYEDEGTSQASERTATPTCPGAGRGHSPGTGWKRRVMSTLHLLTWSSWVHSKAGSRSSGEPGPARLSLACNSVVSPTGWRTLTPSREAMGSTPSCRTLTLSREAVGSAPSCRTLTPNGEAVGSAPSCWTLTPSREAVGSAPSCRTLTPSREAMDSTPSCRTLTLSREAVGSALSCRTLTQCDGGMAAVTCHIAGRPDPP
ncbi:hypothetical protein TREES_T100020461 [Tupaia chinensis]|uniref:Uncharacterized protein n=1 Tax=Tupaia chinensis TaxID=246437 RepID=L9KVR1_TUPCH|nr:hypothetical protein TREES_T100020461 [Tupaia chinensis]